MKKNKYIRIVKIDENKSNRNGIGIDYWAEGFLLTEISVGHSLRALRVRNSKNPKIVSLGNFTTSRVRMVKRNVISTENSTYKILSVRKPKFVNVIPIELPPVNIIPFKQP